MDWYDVLPNHPITAHPSTSDVWRTSSSSHSNDTTSIRRLQVPNRLLATRSSELVVALPGNDATSRIRTIALRELKRACIQLDEGEDLVPDKLPFKQWETPIVTFTIRQIEINPTSSLLAVAGDHDVVVLVLPPPGSFGGSRPPESYVIGEMYHSADQTARIARILWHPSGVNGTCLMVLSSDGNLRIYDIIKDVNNPKQTIPVLPTAPSHLSTLRPLTATNRYGLHDDDDENDYMYYQDASEESVSMCLGHGIGWGRYTLYVLAKSGEVYSICPVMPSRCVVDLSHLQHLQLLLSVNNDNLDKYEEKQTQLQRIFLEELIRAASKSTNLPTESTVVIVPPRGLQHLRVQPLPCRFIPESSSDMLQAASDIVYVPTDPIGSLLIAFNGGTVDLLLEVERPQPWWRDDADPLRNVNLAVMDRLDFAISNQSTPSVPSLIYQDPKYIDTLYVTHGSGIHRVRLSPILEELRRLKLLLSSSNSALKDGLMIRNHVEVDWVVNTRGGAPTPSPVLGLILLTDIYLSYSYVFLHSSIRLHGQSLPLRLAQPTLAPGLIKTQSHDQSKPLYPKYLQTPFQVPTVLQHDLPRIPQVVRGDAMSAEDALRFIADVGGKVIEEVAAVEGASDELHGRILLQSKEFELQQKDLSRLRNIIQNSLHPALDKDLRRLADLTAAQERLTARADIVLQILTDRTQPQLSPEEREWIREVARSIREVRDKSAKQIAVLRSRVELIMEQTKQQQALEAQQAEVEQIEVELGTAQAKRVKEALKAELDLLKDARGRVSKIWEAIETSAQEI
ncbi:hypothetical protein SeMB42_g02541 [Synchytrium endobioticum]|nr:hypothetical protein SeMB42_g02541 [Synchytrium endobioticum]